MPVLNKLLDPWEYWIGWEYYPILFIIGNHDEQIHRKTLSATLRYEHVLRPSAPAKCEFFKGLEILVSWSVLFQVTESCLERDGYSRFY